MGIPRTGELHGSGRANDQRSKYLRLSVSSSLRTTLFSFLSFPSFFTSSLSPSGIFSRDQNHRGHRFFPSVRSRDGTRSIDRSINRSLRPNEFSSIYISTTSIAVVSWKKSLASPTRSIRPVRDIYTPIYTSIVRTNDFSFGPIPLLSSSPTVIDGAPPRTRPSVGTAPAREQPE